MDFSDSGVARKRDGRNCRGGVRNVSRRDEGLCTTSILQEFTLRKRRNAGLIKGGSEVCRFSNLSSWIN